MNKAFSLLLLVVVVLGTSCGDGAPVETAKDIDVSALMEDLKSSDSSVRFTACVELSEGLHTAAPALDALIELVKSDKDPKVREMAGYAIYQMGEEVAMPALPMVKERFEKERVAGVRSVLYNLWGRLELETRPGGAPTQP